MHLHTHKLKHACIQTASYLLNATINLSIHTHKTTVANGGETGKFMYASETLTALSECGRYTKCSLPLISSPWPKTQSSALSLYSQYMLSCSRALKGKPTSLSSTCIFLLIQTRREHGEGCRHSGTTAERLPAEGIKPHPRTVGWIIDVGTHKFSVAF